MDKQTAKRSEARIVQQTAERSEARIVQQTVKRSGAPFNGPALGAAPK